MARRDSADPEIEGFRALLMERRATTEQRLASLVHDVHAIVEANRDANSDDEHDPEGATIAFDREQLDAVADSEREDLRLIEEALQRLDAGTYGRCVDCGESIPRARLEARPTAARCVACAARF